MTCPYCGETLKDTAKFCTNCGKKQPAAEEKPSGEAPGTRPGDKPGDAPAGSPFGEPKPGASTATGSAPSGSASGSASGASAHTGGSYPPPHSGSASAHTSGSYPPPHSTGAPASGSRPEDTGASSGSGNSIVGEIVCGIACVAEIFLFGWFARIPAIAAAVFCVLAFIKRNNGDAYEADKNRRTCIILLLVALGLSILGWIISFIFNLGASLGIFGRIMDLLEGVL